MNRAEKREVHINNENTIPTVREIKKRCPVRTIYGEIR